MAQYPPFTAGATVDAAGNATVRFRGRGSQLVKVTQTAGEMTGGAAALCAIRRNGALVTPCVPTGFAAGGDPPVWLWPGDEMTIEWTGAPPGAVGKVTVFYDIEEP